MNQISDAELVDLERARSIIETTQDAVISKTLQGIITSWNKGAQRIFGYTAAEAIGQPMLFVIPEGRKHEESQFLRRVGSGERIESFETIRQNKQGDLIEVSVTLSPMRDSSGKIVGVSKIARDLTEARTNERLKHEQDRAELAAQTRTELMVSLSHELRTPLNHILGFSQTLSDSATAAQQLQINAIKDAAGQLIEQLSNVLDSVDIERGRMVVVNAPFNVREALQALVQLFERRAEEKGIELDLYCDPDLPAMSVGDAAKFSRLLGNLLDNAIKFTDTGSVRLQARTFEQGLEVVVVDTGCGMNESDLTEAFKPLTQLDRSMTRRSGGIGMGCALADQLARLMDGTISSGSTPGAGTCMVVRLPIYPAMRPLLQPRRLHILAVDDVALNLMLVASLLGKQHHVTTVSSGAAALHALEHRHFDLVLMDVQMPGMDGLQTTRRWRALESSQGRLATPVVALTANASEQDRRKALEAGMDDFLTKPVNRELLTATVERLTRPDKSLPQAA